MKANAVQNSHADINALLASDPWLEPYSARLQDRVDHTNWLRNQLPPDPTLGHIYFGFNRIENGLVYREWAPAAEGLSLIGDFNNWDRNANPMIRDEYGVWTIFLPDHTYIESLCHGSKVKVHVRTDHDATDRIPAYIRRAGADPGTTNYCGQYWNPEPYQWQNHNPAPQSLRIYEAHVGMAREDGRIGTYSEFKDDVLPRIKDLGYNALQLMAIMEHPYYASFGYQVSSFFAPSSRFGTPEELKELIDMAHGMGIAVIMDLIHSHAVKNVFEGLNKFDGTDFQYFHSGARGHHPAWDSMCFDYGKPEVLRFLLSNVRYWLEEFRFDGFRFDGVTSMIYHDHGIGRTFGGYDDYFGSNVDLDAVAYLILANEVAHTVRSGVITIAEDVSGMVGMAAPASAGGLGFDYRLAMGTPDLWIRLLKEQHDEDWNLGAIYASLLDRRRTEKHIAYAESHDQALVGDKTLAFWLMDAAMYTSMSKFTPDIRVDRGVALHKMIRLLTFSLGGEGYLNFMGNEFGHPEWIDFPRPENNDSGHYARRQWSLAEKEDLHYRSLQTFDRAMLRLDSDFGVLSDPLIEQLALHEDTRQLVYRRGSLLFAFNFHATESYPDLRIPVPQACDYRLILTTDASEFGGQGRIATESHYPWQDVPMYGQKQSIMVYLPARSALVFEALDA